MKFQVFTRTWWKINSKWPNKLEPQMGRKTIIGYYDTREQARQKCSEINAALEADKSNKLGRKAEYTSI